MVLEGTTPRRSWPRVRATSATRCSRAAPGPVSCSAVPPPTAVPSGASPSCRRGQIITVTTQVGTSRFRVVRVRPAGARCRPPGRARPGSPWARPPGPPTHRPEWCGSTPTRSALRWPRPQPPTSSSCPASARWPPTPARCGRCCCGSRPSPYLLVGAVWTWRRWGQGPDLDRLPAPMLLVWTFIADQVARLLPNLDVTRGTRPMTPTTARTRDDMTHRHHRLRHPPADAGPAPPALVAHDISAWFGDHQVLDRVSLAMEARQVTALIGPSGCGKSTFLRILNRMHELIRRRRWPATCSSTARTSTSPVAEADRGPSPHRDGVPEAQPVSRHVDLRQRARRPEAHRHPQGTRTRRTRIVQSCLVKAGLWNEVEQPPPPARRRAVRWAAAAAVHRPGAGHPAPGPPDGRALLGARPHVDPADRGDHRGAPRPR